MTKKELIIEALTPYLSGVKPYCIGEDGDCANTIGDNHCAGAQYFKPEYYNYKEPIEILVWKLGQKILIDRVQNILNRSEWQYIRMIHDRMAIKKEYHYFEKTKQLISELSNLIAEPLTLKELGYKK